MSATLFDLDEATAPRPREDVADRTDEANESHPSNPSHPRLPAGPECERCGCVTGHKLQAIHEGRSTRLDCGWCGRTLDFPLWYGVKSDQPSAVSDQPGESGGAA